MPSGYEGTVIRIPLGKEGLTYSKNPSSLPPSGLLQAETVQFSDDSVHLEPGRSNLGGYAGNGAAFTFVAGDVDTGANETIAHTAHGFITADGPVFITTTGTLPGGVTADQDYWLIKFDAHKVSLATSRANALAGTKVDLTSGGTGTHTLAPRSIFSMFDWFPQEGTQYTVTLSSHGRIYITSTATETQLGQNETVPPGATTPQRAVFVECGGEKNGSGRILAVFTGQAAPGFYQRTRLLPSKLSSPPTDWSTSY